MLHYICMTNGGLYGNVSHIDGNNVDDMNNNEIVNEIKFNNFITIKYEATKEAIVRTSCISSINI